MLYPLLIVHKIKHIIIIKLLYFDLTTFFCTENTECLCFVFDVVIFAKFIHRILKCQIGSQSKLLVKVISELDQHVFVNYCGKSRDGTVCIHQGKITVYCRALEKLVLW